MTGVVEAAFAWYGVANLTFWGFVVVGVVLGRRLKNRGPQ